MAHKYTAAQKEFIKEISPCRYNKDITELFNKKFGTSLTENQIKNFKANHKIRSNVKRKRRTAPDKLFSAEQEKFLKNNVSGKFNKELKDMVNKKFSLSVTTEQVKAWKKRNKISSGLRGSEGQKAWNKSMRGLQIGGEETQFKKGRKPENYRPVGSERIDRDGYIQIKVKDEGRYQDRWKHKHVVVWENHHKRKVPKNHVIIFADSNKENFDIDNLLLISRSELVRMNQQDLFSSDPELTKVGLNLVRLGIKVIDYEIYGGSRKEFRKHLAQAKRNGLSEQGFIARLKRGWSLQDAVNKPKHARLIRRKEAVN